MFRISKQYRFSASHQIPGLPKGHQCGRLHGHNYEVWFVLEGDLNEVGMVRDYGDLHAAKAAVEALDHRHLNDFLATPTAEHLALYLFCQAKAPIPELVGVRVSESSTSWAEYWA